MKETAYKTLVRPKLEYCASISDPYHQAHKDRLEAVQRRAARFVCKDYRRKSSVSSMIRSFEWKSLKERRAASRLTLLYKSIHHKVAVDTDHYQAKSEGGGIKTRKSSSISFKHPSSNKDCYKYSFIPRTTAEWNHLPASIREAATVHAFKTNLGEIQMSALIRGAHH